jgi:peptidoglycan/xylan/chitin deacetylase (PgdA/CDA1 family)
MELQEKPVVDKMKKNLVTFCIFAFFLVFAIVQPALAASYDNKIKTMNSTLSENQTKKSILKAIPKVVSPKNTCPCIVFRLDDIQEFYLSDVQIKTMDVFQKKNASLSIGVIGYHLPLDAKLVSYLKNNLKSGHAPIEIANHGWKHENFASLSLSQQVSLMNKTNQELVKTLGIRPHVFITPFNLYNNDTLKAVKQTKMSVISAGIFNEEKFVTTKGNIVANKDLLGLYHVPSMTDFQVNIGNETYWTSIPKNKVIASIDSHISKYGYDVVLLHPQNFAVIVNGQYANTADKKYLDELTSIIDYAKSKHIKITTLSDIAGLDHTNAKPVKKISQTTFTSKSKVAHISKHSAIVNLSRTASYVEPNGTLELNMKYFNGDRVGAYALSLKIYRDFDLTPYKEIKSISENPYVITSLTMYHQYKIMTFVGGMLSSTNLVTLDTPEQDLEVNIPDGGSMQVSVYYNDGQTPIPGANVFVKSQDNKTRDTGIADTGGLVSRFYLPSTNISENYYVVDAMINKHLTFSSSPMTLQPGSANDIRLIAPWPPVIQNLVTVKVYNQTKLLPLHGQPYAVDMYDDKGNKLVESSINLRGEGYFWSMKTGDYVFKVVNVNSGEILGNLVTTLDGTKNNFDLMIYKHSTTQKGDLGKNL